MSRRKNLVAIDGSEEEKTLETSENGASDEPANSVMEDAGPDDLELTYEEEWEEESPRPRFDRTLPVIAIVAVIAWTGFFGWVHHQEMLAGAQPAVWVGWITDWAVPVLLVIGLWLLAMRNSTKEAVRFGETARLLSEESVSLEGRLSTVNRELSLAREFIASQSRDLESLGRVASERISENAEQLQSLIRENGEQVNAIGSVSDTAVSNMDKLRDQLPVIANSARDVASQIGNAGNTAQSQLDDMSNGFARLNEFGDASTKQADVLADKFAALHAGLADLSDEAEKLTQKMRDDQGEVDTMWSSAVAGMQERMRQALSDISKLDEAAMGNARKRLEVLQAAGERLDQSTLESQSKFDEEVQRRREASEEAELAALEALEDRISAFQARNSELQDEHLGHMEALTARGDALGAKLAEFDEELSRLATQGAEEGERMSQASELLAEQFSQSRAILEDNGSFVSHLTDDCVRLLEIIRASAEHSEGALSNAIGNAESRLAQFEVKAAELNETISNAEAKGSSLANYVSDTSTQSSAQLEVLENLQARLSAMAEQSSALALQAREELQNAIGELEEASINTLTSMRTGQTEAVQEIAENIGKESAATIDRALQTGAKDSISQIESASELAHFQGRETANMLRTELDHVNTLVANLEQRVADARVAAEQELNSDFSRNMALISDSLNSSSIEIAKAFDADVSDTNWASYLRGDRGIFTRRAVRLLDNAEARSISEVYEQDEELRDAINRYIHDFEAMLRSVLSTRDGNAIGVTLLSSDIGKLYVALAQAIERLRD